MASKLDHAGVEIVSRGLTVHNRQHKGKLSRDQIFEILSNERRRLVLHYLRETTAQENVSLGELVDQVAAWENGTRIEELRADERKCVYTALRQSHLPKLQREGLVEFDRQRGNVTLQDRAAEIEPYLEYVPGADITWSHAYAALSVSGLLLVLLHWFSLTPFGRVGGGILAAIIVTIFVVTSLAHLYSTKRKRNGYRLDLARFQSH